MSKQTSQQGTAPATQTPDLGGAENSSGRPNNQQQQGDNDGVTFQKPEGYTDPMADLDAIAAGAQRKRDDKGRFEGQGDQQRRRDDSAQGDATGGEGDAGDSGNEGDGQRQRQEASDGEGEGASQGAEQDDASFLESAAYKRSKPLRQAYDKLRENFSAIEKENQQLKQKLEQGDYNTALADENAQLKSRIKQFQSQQVVRDYEQSEEYQSKFIQPIKTLIDSAVQEIDGIQIETGNGQYRMATKQDFLDLIEMPSNLAAKAARAKFGEDLVPHIMSMRQQIRTLNTQRKSALQMAEQNSEEMAKRRIAEQAEQQQHNRRIWVAADNKIVNRFPDLFGEIEGDDEHNEQITKGLREVDLALHPDPSITNEQRLTAMALVRRKAAAFNAMYRKLQSYEDRIEELEGELSKLKAGDPDAGGSGGGGEGGSSKGKFVSADEDPDAPWNRR